VIPAVEERKAQLRELCRRYGVAQLAVFGSAASGTFDPETSDLDFLISFTPMPPVEHAAAYFGMLEALETLFGREIDLIEEEALTNPYVRRSIEASRVLLYAA
jgi:predicted nucleotidyltransferase